jgi:hypothetical protein
VDTASEGNEVVGFFLRPTLLTILASPVHHPHAPESRQVRDTVELFHFRRHRKLSLRFLASYILGSTIQVRV